MVDAARKLSRIDPASSSASCWVIAATDELDLVLVIHEIDLSESQGMKDPESRQHSEFTFSARASCESMKVSNSSRSMAAGSSVNVTLRSPRTSGCFVAVLGQPARDHYASIAAASKIHQRDLAIPLIVVRSTVSTSLISRRSTARRRPF